MNYEDCEVNKNYLYVVTDKVAKVKLIKKYPEYALVLVEKVFKENYESYLDYILNRKYLLRVTYESLKEDKKE